MVTASHNPAQDNGCKPYSCIEVLTAHFNTSDKVYWSNGVQIVPPHDAGIAQSIDSNLEVPEEAWSPETLLASAELCIDSTEELKEAYIETLVKLDQDRLVRHGSS